MLEYLGDNSGVEDEGQDPHLGAASTGQRVDQVEEAKQASLVAHCVKLRLGDVHQQTGEEVHRVKVLRVPPNRPPTLRR